MSIHQRLRSWCLLLALSCVTLFAAAHASGGIRIGLAAALPEDGVVAANLHAALPLVRFQSGEHPVQLAGRLGLTAPVDFSAPPAVGVSVMLMADGGSLRPYLGGGAGLSFLSGGDSGVLLSSFAYTGMWLHLASSWGVNLEGSVNVSGAGVRPGLTLGVSNTFGAGR